MKMVNYRLHVPTYATQSKKIALPPLARRGLAFVIANHMPAMLNGGGQAVQAHHIRLRGLSRTVNEAEARSPIWPAMRRRQPIRPRFLRVDRPC
ncbi:hypothetical protein LJR296_006659 [Cupriavidus necator]|uniref:hypothetical protein n=1 Tax=Cupriavidus necator TaxID=106590 RepID=UPI003ECCCEF5